MSGSARRLVSDSAIYGLGGVANQALAVILVPIYANVLGVQDFGVMALVNTTLSLATTTVTLALPQAFFRSYLMEHDDIPGRARVLSTALGLRLMVSLVGLALLLLLAFPLTELLFGDSSWLPLMLLIGPIVFSDTLNLIPLSLLRAERQPAAYAALSFSRAVLGSVMIIVFVVGFQLGVLGVVLGALVASVTVAAVGVAILGRAGRLRVAVDRPLAGRMLAFSLPLVPASIASWTLNLSDRYLIGAFQGHAAVGVYSAGYTIGLVVNALVVAPFALAWGATFWQISKSPRAPEIYARIMAGFVVAASFIALLLSAAATDGLRILFKPAFEEGRFVVPFSALAYVLYGVYTVGATGINVEGRTRVLPITTGIAAALNVGLNLVLIPWVGYIGAAAATVVSYGALAISTTLVSQRYYPVPWHWWRMAAAMGLAGSLSAASLLGPDHLAWRGACVVAYPIIVLITGIVRREDLEAVFAGLRRRGEPPAP
jgi:O-antigen/teichoic acid export membrane protein